MPCLWGGLTWSFLAGCADSVAGISEFSVMFLLPGRATCSRFCLDHLITVGTCDLIFPNVETKRACGKITRGIPGYIDDALLRKQTSETFPKLVRPSHMLPAFLRL